MIGRDNQGRHRDTDHQPRVDELQKQAWAIARVGLLAAACVIGGFSAWSLAFPLAKGTIAMAAVEVQSSRKTISHLEGGIIDHIHVREGDRVNRGDVLITLDTTVAAANFNLMRRGLLTGKSVEARLLAQRDGITDIRFPEMVLLESKSDPEIEEAVNRSRQALAAFIAKRNGRRSILEEQIFQSEQRIKGMEAQNSALDRQRDLIAQEIKNVRFLLDKGLERLPRVLSLERSRAGLDGQIEANVAEIARIRNEIGEARLKIIDDDNTLLNQTLAELERVQGQNAEMQDRLSAAEDVLKRRRVTAPQEGIIMNVKFATPGSSIPPHAAIMDLVPVGDDLVLVGRVPTSEIESLVPGQPVWVTFSAFSRRDVPTVEGRLVEISPDRKTDERTGEPYYEVRAKIPAGTLDQFDGIRITAGMPAELAIVTGERTAFEYLSEPLFASFRRATIKE